MWQLLLTLLMLLLTSVHMALFFNEAAFVSRNLLNAFFSLSFSSPSLSMRYLRKLWILKSLKAFVHLRFLTKMPLKIWASKLHDWSWSHGSIRTPSFVINLARKLINNPKPHNFYFYFILTPYN